jgi:hypothetical protein
MRESRTSGSARGAKNNPRRYRDHSTENVPEADELHPQQPRPTTGHNLLLISDVDSLYAERAGLITSQP